MVEGSKPDQRLGRGSGGFPTPRVALLRQGDREGKESILGRENRECEHTEVDELGPLPAEGGRWAGLDSEQGLRFLP